MYAFRCLGPIPDLSSCLNHSIHQCTLHKHTQLLHMLKGPEKRAGMTCENTETLVYAGFVTVSERGSHVSNYLCALFIVN